MKYKIIYADPPWNYKQKSLNRGGAERHYKTLKISEIKKLNIQSISEKDSVLFIWGTWPVLPDCLEVIKAWGFEYKTCGFIWVKSNKRTNKNQLTMMPVYDFFMGMGFYTRSNSEFCLLAIKGKGLKRLAMNVRQVVYEPIGKHSKKPQEVRNRIISLYGEEPRIELFATKKTEGWDSWGNMIESDIELKFK